MEILYISSVPSPKEFQHTKDTFKTGFIYGMNESGFKFHSLIMQGMCADPDVHIHSVVGRSVSMQTHKGLFWKTQKETLSENLHFHHIGFLNIPVVKHLCIGCGYFFQTLKWALKNRKNQRAIVMDAAYVTVHPFVLAANAFCKSHITSIFCDIYDYMGNIKDTQNNEPTSLPHRLLRKMAASSYAKCQSFIFLTEQMSDVVNPQHKPYIVMEGLVDVNMKEMPNTLEGKAPEQIIMYAGALRAKYGLKNLIEGFMAYQNPDVRLWIFGAGDYAPSIEAAAKEDSRIHFGGMIPLAQVVETELKSTLLVNARPIGLKFTQYSFPSKNMEYMVSGTPVLTTRLPGMPKDYYPHVYTIDGDTPEAVTQALEITMSNTREQLHEKGMAARDFVLEKKNNVAQAKRILALAGYTKEATT